MGSLLLPLAIGTIAVGQIAQGQAAKTEAENQAAIAEYNAQVSENEAKAIEQRGKFESAQQAQEAARRLSTLSLGFQGVVGTTGAPLLAKATQSTQDELSNLIIGFDTRTAASRARSQATLFRLQGSAAKSRGKAAVTSSFIGAAGTILGGFAFAGSPKTGAVPAGSITTRAESLQFRSGGVLSLNR